MQLLQELASILSPGREVSYPFRLCREPSIMLDRVSASMYYVWFDPELAHDMVLVRMQKICREVQHETKCRITIDNGYIEQGRLVIRVNLAISRHDNSLCNAIFDIMKVIKTTADPSLRNAHSFVGGISPDGSSR